MANVSIFTFELFKKRLADGTYKSITGARRGIGRSDWSEKDKDIARGLAEKYFGAEASEPKAAKATKKSASTPPPAAKTKKSAKAPTSKPEVSAKAASVKPAKATAPSFKSVAPSTEKVSGNELDASSRVVAASRVIESLANRSRTQEENTALHVALAEYVHHADPAAVQALEARHTATAHQPKAAKAPAKDPTPLGRVDVSDEEGTEDEGSSEEDHEAVAATPAAEGLNGFGGRRTFPASAV